MPRKLPSSTGTSRRRPSGGSSPPQRVTTRRTSWLLNDQQPQPSAKVFSSRCDGVADALGRAGAAQQVEAVGDVEAAAVGVLGRAQERVVAADLAQDHLAVVALGQRVQGLEEQLDQLGPGLVPELVLHGEGRARGAAADRAHPARRVVAQLGVVDAEIDRVEPEAVDAALEPEAGLGQERLDHLRVSGS